MLKYNNGGVEFEETEFGFSLIMTKAELSDEQERSFYSFILEALKGYFTSAKTTTHVVVNAGSVEEVVTRKDFESFADRVVNSLDAISQNLAKANFSAIRKIARVKKKKEDDNKVVNPESVAELQETMQLNQMGVIKRKRGGRVAAIPDEKYQELAEMMECCGNTCHNHLTAEQAKRFIARNQKLKELVIQWMTGNLPAELLLNNMRRIKKWYCKKSCRGNIHGVYKNAMLRAEMNHMRRMMPKTPPRVGIYGSRQ